jgi:uncharacterized iron-regulated protein
MAMRTCCTILLLLLGAACATPARIVATADDKVRSLDQVAADLATADVVVLGEQHATPAVHRMHHELVRKLYERRPDLVLAFECFERDVQGVLLQYLGGMTDEATFLAKARPWKGYETDYRPLVEFGKQHGLVVLAANAPRPLAQKVGKQGVDSVAGDPLVARETTAPEDEYWDAFVGTMGAHIGSEGDDAMKRMYAAQCLKDDTMAETIVDHLQQYPKAAAQPLVVLVVGQFHADHRRGVVARIQSRRPELAIRVLSTETVDDLDRGVYSAPRSIGDYVVLVEGQPEPAVLPPLPKPATAPAAEPAAAPAPVAVPTEGNQEAPRPALGLQPDYGSAAEGVAVQSVREGGPAEKAGIEPGDVIVEMAGKPVTSMESYVAILGEQTIGKLVGVRVRRGEAEVLLQVMVTARAR